VIPLELEVVFEVEFEFLAAISAAKFGIPAWPEIGGDGVVSYDGGVLIADRRLGNGGVVVEVTGLIGATEYRD
jgi:hypothetical protein